MAPLTYAILAFVVFTFFTREGTDARKSVPRKERETFGDLCVKYDPKERLDDLPDGKGRVCRLSQDRAFRVKKQKRYRYCKTFDCPTVKCRNPKKERDGCLHCPRQCQWGGKIYRPGTGGTCVDGCNRCNCGKGGSVMMTAMGCSDKYFCSPRKWKKSNLKNKM